MGERGVSRSLGGDVNGELREEAYMNFCTREICVVDLD